jgi:hypothetical protein
VFAEGERIRAPGSLYVKKELRSATTSPGASSGRTCPASIARPCTSEAPGADIDALGIERGHRTLTVLRQGGKIVTIPLAPVGRTRSHD